MNKQKESVVIKDFNLNLLGTLLNQSLTVTSQLMLEFNNGMLKSCSFSQTKSLIKLWTIPYEKLIFIPKKEVIEDVNQISLDDDKVEVIIPEIPTFNFYILNGMKFKNYISVFSSECVDITFNLQDIDGKKQATSLVINGKSSSGSPLEAEFALTTEELLTNSISDYNEILSACTPEKHYYKFNLSNKQISEIRGLIRKLQGSTENTAYLVFEINNEKITIKDRVFNISFKNENLDIQEKFQLSFNILKSDFILIGDHNFHIHTYSDVQKVIFGAKFGDSIIWCMCTKVGEQSDENDEEDDILDSLSIEQYIDMD